MRPESLTGSEWRAVAPVALLVALVLADSAIVTLALPDILRELDAEVRGVAWVLIAFNAVLAVATVPLAVLLRGRRGIGGGAVAGAVLFAVASAGCALAPTLGALIAARVVQAVGGGLVVAASLELLIAVRGSERAGLRSWVGAGVAGLATGPAAGGLLTQAFSWQSIFWVQVPVALATVPALRAAAGRVRPRARERVDRPALAANLALALLSAALTAALFLLVLLLIEGWRLSPATAALAVTVVPVAALAGGPLARLAGAGVRAEAVAGSVCIAGGLVALAYLPAAEPLFTAAPQALIGLGMGCTLDTLTRFAIANRSPRAVHGAWTISSRHAGIVLGIALLTPVFTSDLLAARPPAQEAIAAEVLDSSLSPRGKVRLATALGDRLTAEEGRVPDLAPAFREARPARADQREGVRLRSALEDQLERAATDAFRDSFLLGALLAGLGAACAFGLGRRP